MLWRVRTNLPDRPGALAALARTCGESGVDIRRIQVLSSRQSAPHVRPDGFVTDELVLDAPDSLGEAGVVALVAEAGGSGVLAMRCAAAALADQPTRYVEAARSVIAQPTSFPEVVAHLFDAETVDDAGPADVMELRVVDVRVQIGRRVPFTVAERERGLAMAALVSDVLGRERGAGTPAGRAGGEAHIDYEIRESVVLARADGVEVGRAELLPASTHEPDRRELDLVVDPAWQRRGIGTRLLGDLARLARTQGADELMARTRADDQVVMGMVLRAGMRARIRMSGDELTVVIPLRDVRPFD